MCAFRGTLGARGDAAGASPRPTACLGCVGAAPRAARIRAGLGPAPTESARKKMRRSRCPIGPQARKARPYEKGAVGGA